MLAENILLVGAGGHALACIDVIEAGGDFKIQGLIASADEVGEFRLGYPIVGSDEDLLGFRQKFVNALVCVGQIKSPALREKLYQKLCEAGYVLPVIVAPTAWVSPHAKIAAGSIVMHGAIVNAGAQIGENCIINSQALIEHDAVIGDHCHISTGALVNGGVTINRGTFLGSGAKVKEGVRIGHSCIVGIGAVISADIGDGEIIKTCNLA